MATTQRRDAIERAGTAFVYTAVLSQTTCRYGTGMGEVENSPFVTQDREFGSEDEGKFNLFFFPIQQYTKFSAIQVDSRKSFRRPLPQICHTSLTS